MKDAAGSKNSVRIRQNSNGFRIYIDGELKSNSEEDLFDLTSVDSTRSLSLNESIQQAL